MTHTYVSSRNSGLNFTVVYKDAETDKEVRERVKFEKGQFQTDNAELAAGIDKLIETKMNIRARVKKADKSAAEKMLADHLAQQKNTGAHKGGVTAVAMQNAMQDELQTRDTELQAAGVNKESIAADESLILTEKGVTAPSPDLGRAAPPAEEAGEAGGIKLAAKPAPSKLKLG